MTVIAPQLPPREPMWRLTVAQYHEMIESGILTADDHVEMIEGWLVARLPKDPPHVVATELVAEKLNEVKPAGWHVRRQDPITTDDSEPEPDVALVRGGRRDYLQRHPGPSDVVIVVEVADTTLQRDRTLKLRAYARARVQLYWIVNLVDARVEVFADPTGPSENPDYSHRFTRNAGETVELVVDGRTVASVAVKDLLP